jgi:hypothetical protein
MVTAIIKQLAWFWDIQGIAVLLSCGACSGILLGIKGAKILSTRSPRQQLCMVAPDVGAWLIDIQNIKIHSKGIVPYMHAWFAPLPRKTLEVCIILHSCTCPLKSLCRLDSNDSAVQEGCECFVVCWAEVCGGYSVFFQKCKYGCELLTCKITAGNLLLEKAACKPWSSEEDMAHIRD